MNSTHHELHFKQKFNMKMLTCSRKTGGKRITQTHLNNYHDLNITNAH